MAGGYYRWVGDEAEAGRWGSLLNGRLQALHHLFGHLSLTHAALERRPDGYELSVELVTKTGIDILITESQVDCRRVRELTVYDHHGRVITRKVKKPVALFEADLEVFRAKIAGDQIDGLTEEADVIYDCLSHLILNIVHRNNPRWSIMRPRRILFT